MNHNQAKTIFLDAFGGDVAGAKRFRNMFKDFKYTAFQAVFKREEELHRDHERNFAMAIVYTMDGETSQGHLEQLKYFARWLLAFKCQKMRTTLTTRIWNKRLVSVAHRKHNNLIRSIENAARVVIGE